jgi:serine protease Do
LSERRPLAPMMPNVTDRLDIGHMVLAMGSPFGLSRSVTFGIIGAKSRRSLKLGAGGAVLNQDFLQTDAAINPGNSGGPLIDMHGRVVGINTAIASNSGGNEGIGFSIPSNLVRRVADQLLENGRVRRAYLGVKLDAHFDAEAARRLNLDRVRGARVVEVYPNTPASRANLRPDDVILKFDGIDIQDENHLINLVSLAEVGRRVQLVVFRDGRQITMQMLLADRSELEQRSQIPLPPLRREFDEPDYGFSVEPMGLTVDRLDSGLAAQVGFEETAEGLLVTNVDPSGPLGGRLELYDLLEEVARTPVMSVEDLQRVLEEHEASDAIVLKVRRQTGGQPQSRLVIWRRSSEATPDRRSDL